MSRDLMLGWRKRIEGACLLLVAALVALSGCSGDAKSEEKRLLSEINELHERSREHLASDEMRAPMVRLNELRPSFPERRDEISTEAQAVKAHFTRIIEDDKKLVELFGQLLTLPLSDSYSKCVTTQMEIQELMTIRSQKVVEEMDMLLDPSVTDRQVLDARVDAQRGNSGEIDQKLRERDSYLDQNCRQAPANGPKQ